MQTLKTPGRLRQALAAMGPFFAPFVSLVFLLCTEWIHRGALSVSFWQTDFLPRWPTYLFTFLLIWCGYQLIALVTRRHAVAVVVTGLLCFLPATVTYFKLKLRGEPFFPWDFSQISEATDVMGKAGIQVQTSMWVSGLILLGFTVAACFIPVPKTHWKGALLRLAAPLAGFLVLIFGVFLSPTGSRLIGIVPDMWMQNRYYRNYGVIAGFLTNIQTLKVNQPGGYSKEAVDELAEKAQSEDLAPVFSGSYKQSGNGMVKQPNIIFVMNESFWDASELEDYGFAFDQPLTPNLQKLRQIAAYGKAYTPSFGGGTCDVEFEALTGYSVEFLPGGCKPFQQHVTKPMFSLPSYLKEQGYATQAIHGYYAKFWSRTTAYPNLGIDDFVALEDFVAPEKKRSVYWQGGLVTDAEMARRVIAEYEARDEDQPLFMHVVTMQNHTSYNEKNYPADELVKVTQAPAGVSQKTKGALQDFVTGVKEADAMLGTLTEYFSQVKEPTILVFWGDHYNPIGSGYEVYTASGYASEADSEAPELHKMPLLIWSNYWQGKVDLGTIATYQISPVTMELYDLDKPVLFQHLANQLSVYRGRTHGVTVLPDSTTTDQDLTQEQQAWFDEHWMLQYDLMFGNEYVLDTTQSAT